jgi:hypothetical protein
MAKQPTPQEPSADEPAAAAEVTPAEAEHATTETAANSHVQARSATPSLPQAPMMPAAAQVSATGAGTPPVIDAAAPTQQPITTPPEAPSCERHRFSAHARSLNGPLDMSPHRVPAGTEEVMVFYYRASWQGERQALSVQLAFDNPRIVHHWAFYATNAPLTSGDVLEGLFYLRAPTTLARRVARRPAARITASMSRRIAGTAGSAATTAARCARAKSRTVNVRVADPSASASEL